MNLVWNRWLAAVSASLVLLAVAGCGKKADSAGKNGGVQNAAADSGGGHNYKGRDWCGEHGVPESECALCNAEIAAKYKEKGDWCGEHDRPESQCFICNPKNQEKFAAAYKLKFGEDPPPIRQE